jgi:threonine/homoserine/homoserine lactone efflux protein
MTITGHDIWLYALGLLALFLTPGPVWVALTARALAGGFRSAAPLALGVMIGDVLWPFLAILGMGWLVSHVDGVLTVLKWVAAGTFLLMGWLVLRHADATIGADSRLTKPGLWAGFAVGVAVIIGNPKAILFYSGILPGFFDLSSLTWPDIAVICALSAGIPLIGNLALSWFIGQARAILSSPRATRRVNLVAGGLLIAVGLAIPFM